MLDTTLALLPISPTAFLAVTFVLALTMVVPAIVRSQMLALGLLLALFIPSYAMRDQLDLSTNIGSIHIMALDALCALLLVLGFFRAVTGSRRTGLGALAFFLVLLLAIHFARGVEAHGLQTATNSSRSWFYLLSSLIYSATVPKPWDRRAWRLIVVAGLALAAIAMPYLLTEGFHSTTRRVLVNGEFVDSRPVVAAGALLILQAAIVMLALQWPSSRSALYGAGLAGAALILLQHRTVWIAAVTAGFVGFVIWSRRRGREAHSLVFGATGLAVIVLPVVLGALARSSTLRVSAGETTQKKSTFQWRIDSWVDLVSSHHSASDIALGEPAGTSWVRVIFGERTDVSAHSSFVEAFLRFGVVGVALLLLLLLLLFRRRTDIARLTGLTSTAVLLLLVTQALFAVTYTLSAIEGAILGIFISSLAWERKTSDEEALEAESRSRLHYAVAPGL